MQTYTKAALLDIFSLMEESDFAPLKSQLNDGAVDSLIWSKDRRDLIGDVGSLNLTGSVNPPQREKIKPAFTARHHFDKRARQDVPHSDHDDSSFKSHPASLPNRGRVSHERRDPRMASHSDEEESEPLWNTSTTSRGMFENGQFRMPEETEREGPLETNERLEDGGKCHTLQDPPASDRGMSRFATSFGQLDPFNRQTHAGSYQESPTRHAVPQDLTFNTPAQPEVRTHVPSTMITPEAVKWFYRDMSGNLQGPFNGVHMHDWQQANYFPLDLPVAREGCEFNNLGSLMRILGPAPFLTVFPPVQHVDSATLSGQDDEQRMKQYMQPQSSDDMSSRTHGLQEDRGLQNELPTSNSSEEPPAPFRDGTSVDSRKVPRSNGAYAGHRQEVPPLHHDDVKHFPQRHIKDTLSPQSSPRLSVAPVEPSPAPTAPQRGETARRDNSIVSAAQPDQRRKKQVQTASVASSVPSSKSPKEEAKLEFPREAVSVVKDTSALADALKSEPTAELEKAASPAPAAPWAERKVSSSEHRTSIKDILTAEQREQQTQANQKKHAQTQVVTPMKPVQGATSSPASAVPIPRSPSSGAGPWIRPQSVTPIRKSMAEIQKEERDGARRMAAAKSNSAAANIKRFSDTARMGQGSAGASPATAKTNGAGPGWTTVGEKGKTTPSPAVPVSAPPSAPKALTNAKAPQSSQPNSTPNTANAKAIEEEFLRWCRVSLKGLKPDVNTNEFLSMIISLPLDSPAETLEIISDSVYAASHTIDGRRFAEEFIKRKKDLAKGEGGWNAVVQKTHTPEKKQERNSAFRIVESKKRRH